MQYYDIVQGQPVINQLLSTIPQLYEIPNGKFPRPCSPPMRLSPELFRALKMTKLGLKLAGSATTSGALHRAHQRGDLSGGKGIFLLVNSSLIPLIGHWFNAIASL